MARRAELSLLLLFLLLYILPLGVRPLARPDEFRYGEIPREMRETGDWVVPRLNGLRYFEKPILGHWIHGGAMLLLGETPFALRFPSALATGVCALLLFWMLRRFAADPVAATIGAGAYLVSPLVFALGTLTILDNLLTVFLTSGMLCFFLATRAQTRLRRAGLLGLFGVFCGLAFLTKGFLAFAFPSLALFAFLVWERRWKWLLLCPWLPLLCAFLVSLPWALLIHEREPDFWHYFFWVEHVGRFLNPRGGQHPEPFWFFVPVLAGSLFPLIFSLPAAVRGLKARGFEDPFLRFALCWLLVPFLFFSACRGKLIPYILPCLPPLMLLLGVGLARTLGKGPLRGLERGASVLGGLLLLVALALLCLPLFPPAGAWLPALFNDKEGGKVLALSITLLLWSLCLVLGSREPRTSRKVPLFFMGPALFLLASPFLLPKAVFEDRAPEAFLLEFRHLAGPETALVTNDDLVHPLCWTYRRADITLLFDKGELGYGLAYPDGRGRFLQDVGDLAAFIAERKAMGKTTLIVLEKKEYGLVREGLPMPPLAEEARGGIVLAAY